MDLVKVNPEAMEVANSYLQNFSIEETAQYLDLSPTQVSNLLDTPAVKRYIDSVFMDTGYRNRHKIGQVLDKMIEAKLEEAEETEIYTNKDLLDLLKFANDMRKDSSGPQKQTNVQVNHYNRLMEDLAAK